MSLRSMLIALFLISAAAAYAQETHGYIGGRVLDPQSSPVAGCPVIVIHIGTGATTRVETSASGYYEANLLPPGTYEITASAPGFKKLGRKGIALAVGARLDIDLKLELGAVRETVSVTADAPLLQSDSGSTRKVMDSHSLHDVAVLH